MLGRYLLEVFYAPQKVAVAVAIRHKKNALNWRICWGFGNY
nr:MAG TPA: hypothetical protein [Caudoviricetes sp.]